jgi:hypothetical protein
MIQPKPQRRWRPSKLQARVDDAARQAAAREAARIPWPQLLRARQSYVKWRAFQHWVRAIEESEGRLPEWLAHVVKKRCPGFEQFLSRQSTQEHRWPQPAWHYLQQWINERIFAKPRREGWMNAVGYYAVRDLRALRNDAYWYSCEPQWERSKPAAYPSFRAWRKASESCTDDVIEHFDTTEEIREILKLSRLVSSRTLRKTVDEYLEWQLFAYWVRTGLERGRHLPESMNREIRLRCPGFLESAVGRTAERGMEPEDRFKRLLRWIEEHEFARARTEGWLPVLVRQAHLHPRHQRLVDYWRRGQGLHSKQPSSRYPSFGQWTAAVDAYTFEAEDIGLRRPAELPPAAGGSSGAPQFMT